MEKIVQGMFSLTLMEVGKAIGTSAVSTASGKFFTFILDAAGGGNASQLTEIMNQLKAITEKLTGISAQIKDLELNLKYDTVEEHVNTITSLYDQYTETLLQLGKSTTNQDLAEQKRARDRLTELGSRVSDEVYEALNAMHTFLAKQGNSSLLYLANEKSINDGKNDIWAHFCSMKRLLLKYYGIQAQGLILMTWVNADKAVKFVEGEKLILNVHGNLEQQDNYFTKVVGEDLIHLVLPWTVQPEYRRAVVIRPNSPQRGFGSAMKALSMDLTPSRYQSNRAVFFPLQESVPFNRPIGKTAYVTPINPFSVDSEATDNLLRIDANEEDGTDWSLRGRCEVSYTDELWTDDCVGISADRNTSAWKIYPTSSRAYALQYKATSEKYSNVYLLLRPPGSIFRQAHANELKQSRVYYGQMVESTGDRDDWTKPTETGQLFSILSNIGSACFQDKISTFDNLVSAQYIESANKKYRFRPIYEDGPDQGIPAIINTVDSTYRKAPASGIKQPLGEVTGTLCGMSEQGVLVALKLKVGKEVAREDSGERWVDRGHKEWWWRSWTETPLYEEFWRAKGSTTEQQGDDRTYNYCILTDAGALEIRDKGNNVKWSGETSGAFETTWNKLPVQTSGGGDGSDGKTAQ